MPTTIEQLALYLHETLAAAVTPPALEGRAPTALPQGGLQVQ